MSLRDQAVFVANATSRPGLACTHRLAAGGAGIVFTGADEEAVTAAEAELGMHGVPVYGIHADMSRAREVETALGEAMRVFGHIDAVVALIPTTQAIPLTKLDDHDFDRALSQGVRATFLVCQRAARLMATDGTGRIVIVTGSFGRPPSFVDRTVAGAMMAMAKALATDLAPSKIRVNWVVDGGGRESVDPAAAAVAFLVGEEAAALSGAAIMVPGRP